MDQLQELLNKNKEWAAGVRARDPQFFENLCNQQAPDYLWIGCSDSRVPANTIVGLAPGEVFVHRNVANLIKQADMNGLSAIQFAVDVLKVKHIIVCGHYNCGAIVATIGRQRLGLCDNWLGQVRALARKHAHLLAAAGSEAAQTDLLCRLNVIEQVNNACETTVVRDAWERDQELTIHGWIYRLQDGVLQDLGMSVSGGESVAECYQRALVTVTA